MKIRSWLVASSFCFISSVFAAQNDPVSFEFQSVSLVSFLQSTYKNLLHRDYVISPEVLGMDKHISLSVKTVSGDQVGEFVDGVLSDQGITVQRQKNGIYYLGVAPVRSEENSQAKPIATASPLSEDHVAQPQSDQKSLQVVKTYMPQNRPVEFMVAVINAAFGRPVAKPAGSLVVLSATKDLIVQIEDLCNQVDFLPRTVEVSASFIEVATTKSQSSGLALAANILGARFSGTVGAGGGAVTITSGNFSLILDALVADGRFKQVSNSKVVGDESEKVNLTVGDETPTLQSSGRDNAGNTVQSVVYRSSGVILDVLPRVLGSGRLALTVDGQVSSFKATTTGVTGSPTLSKRQVKTAVTVGDGDVLIIGGLEDSTNSDDRNGLSFLPKSWSGHTASDKRTDLLLVLSAKTVKVSSR